MPEKSEYTKALDKIQNTIHGDLKQQGFKKKGRTHNKSLPSGIVHVINFQSGEFPIGDNYIIPGVRESLYGKFTVNLGVFINEVYQATDDFPLQSFVQEYICQIRIRLPELIKKTNDWWPINENFDQNIAEIKTALHNEASVWFNLFSEREKIIANIQNENISNLNGSVGKLNAALMLIHSDKQKGIDLLKKHYEASANHKGHQEYVLKLAKKLGVQI